MATFFSAVPLGHSSQCRLGWECCLSAAVSLLGVTDLGDPHLVCRSHGMAIDG